jgi:8-hydroxy-5-deazaflavin:NADPH oxidoreductase
MVALPKGRAGRIALPVAGSDGLAKAQVIKLLDEIGFDGLDAGTLQESWRQQPGTPAYCTDLDAALYPEQWHRQIDRNRRRFAKNW